MLVLVIISCVVAAGALISYAFVARRDELQAQRAVSDAVTETAKRASADQAAAAQAVAAGRDGGLGGGTAPQALAPDRLVEALAKLADSMSRLRTGVAALLLAFGLLIFAGLFATAHDKLSNPTASTQPQSPNGDTRTSTTPGGTKTTATTSGTTTTPATPTRTGTGRTSPQPDPPPAAGGTAPK